MNYTTARSHPLNISRTDCARVADIVPMLNRSTEHLGHRFNPAMRVPGKAFHIISGIVRTEMVEEQERIGKFRVVMRENTLQLDSGPVIR